MRLFNPITMTEVIHGFHETELLFNSLRITVFHDTGNTEGMRLDVNEKGEANSYGN